MNINVAAKSSVTFAGFATTAVTVLVIGFVMAHFLKVSFASCAAVVLFLQSMMLQARIQTLVALLEVKRG